MGEQPQSTILVTDDDESNRTTMARLLRRAGYRVLQAASGEEALRLLREDTPAVLFTDLRMPGMSGQELLKAARITAPDTEVIVVTAYGTVQIAVEAMKVGAWDFVTKPLSRAELLRAARKALEHRALKVENRSLRAQLEERGEATLRHGMVGNSQAMQRVFQLIDQVGPTRAGVLITGESGTGKELVARAIHRLSPRASGPLVKLSCAALPDSLLEAELFGHEAHAFTGAGKARAGRFEAADGGSLFLDEIGEISLTTQVKLLRVLQEGEIERLGSSRTRKVDIRVIAATNADLRQAVRERTFRQDLYYRLNVIHIELPPLRRRHGDIPLLASWFLRRFAGREQRGIEGISQEALDLLTRYPWPGNVRQLENAMERAVILSRGSQIEATDLPFEVQEASELEAPASAPAAGGEGRRLSFALGTPLREIERVVIHETLKETGGDKNLAARMLGIAARTIYRRLEDESEKKRRS